MDKMQLRRQIIVCEFGTFAALVLFLLLYQAVPVFSNDNKCNKPVGLQDYSVPDSNFKASMGGNSAAGARLNGRGAWCFSMSQANGQKVTLTIDLGRIVLVSGIQSQGPPLNVFDELYNRHIGFNLLNSTATEGEEFDICCGKEPVSFLADDQRGESGKVTTHPLERLVPARRLRISIPTDIRWPGHDTKCFRFEVLGCPQGESRSLWGRWI
ncbi:uncharacterized protein LOC122262140, partial [Penaeus japonicus]|uniref:uncharacterized protein LOC122262140 n=1 Tax=Penaeus japonicus TaxID=27405 RepID=UPI001C712660